MIVSKTGEVGEFLNVDQFQPAKSEFECGFFAVATVDAMGSPGTVPTQSVGQVIAEAEGWYAQYDGSDAPSNVMGMTEQQLYDLLTQIELHYRATVLDAATLRAYIRLGFPVIVAVPENSVYDLGLGDHVPYPWTPTGSHIIVLTGIAPDGVNFLVRDSANCTNLFDPNSLRPGPRTYDAGKLQFISATVVSRRGMPTPPATPTGGQSMSQVPNGWQDDGTALTAPNSVKVIQGFREEILNFPGGWNPNNYPLDDSTWLNPLEQSNPALGQGSQQVFRYTVLEYTSANGVFVAWVGQEFLKYKALLAAEQAATSKLQTDNATITTQLQTVSAQYTAAQAQISALQQQLAAAQAGSPAPTPPPVADALAEQCKAVVVSLKTVFAALP